ncbi:MAG: hypothetical protein ACP5D0_07610 [Hydrogenovibrio sp.]
MPSWLKTALKQASQTKYHVIAWIHLLNQAVAHSQQERPGLVK